MSRNPTLRELITQYEAGSFLFTEPLNRAFQVEVLKPKFVKREHGYVIQDILGIQVPYGYSKEYPECRIEELEAWEKYWEHEVKNYVADLQALLGIVAMFCQKDNLSFSLDFWEGAWIVGMEKVYESRNTLPQLAIIEALLNYTEAQDV